MSPDDDAQDYLCIGICLPDADEAYCIGCGRPWGQRELDDLRMPPEAEDDPSAAPA